MVIFSVRKDNAFLLNLKGFPFFILLSIILEPFIWAFIRSFKRDWAAFSVKVMLVFVNSQTN